MQPSRHLSILCCVALASAGCGGPGKDAKGGAQATAPGKTAGGNPVEGDEVAAVPAGIADGVLEIEIPGHSFQLGSMTGLPGRDPATEMDLVAVELEAFTIDRYPYPNVKGVAPRTEVTLAEARSLCEAAGKRLCTEVEWEAACKGPQGLVFPYGSSFEADRYGQGLDAIASGYGVAGMGALVEWTDSEWKVPESPDARGQVVRGAAPEEPGSRHRCAARGYRTGDKTSSLVGFRCCSGPRNGAMVVLEGLEKPFVEIVDMQDEKFSELVRAIPELTQVGGDPRRFARSDLDYVLLRRNIDTTKSYPGYIFTTNPLWWHPVRGEELIAFTGYSGVDSFVAALYHLGAGRFRHAASMALLGKGAITYKVPVPIILVAGVDRDVLNWGPCWNCSEGGALYYDEATGTIQVSHRW